MFKACGPACFDAVQQPCHVAAQLLHYGAALGILQHFLDDYLKENAGEIDYIHDDDALIGFAKQENAIGFLLPAMEKSQLFRGVIADGVLPRKTFSMGHSREKRYYLEGRKIKA